MPAGKPKLPTNPQPGPSFRENVPSYCIADTGIFSVPMNSFASGVNRK